ncbi:minor capsid protein [Lactiplantibacillus plantarum]|uniref:minor capsid protein n=1 Tax=Lactiplantibacillus plantarum TaxID=1590 RepID=UPI00107662F9|nr:minor capsid protein [Lactiplantibacillus plantarum]TFZ27294.1 capsid protein [Lactiplantibacillus plantarum]
MSISVSTDFTGLNRKFSEANLKHGRIAAANDAMQAMNTNYVPMLHTDSNTNLRAESKVSTDGSSIIWNATYARAQFYGMVGKAPGHRVYKYTTPGTSRRWDLRLKGNANLMKKVSETFVNGAGFNG